MAIRRQVFTFADSIRSYLLGRKAELGLLRAHWIIGPPFVDLKSLATMSTAGWLVGDNCGRLCLQNLVSIIVGDKPC
jgi:hypothetical protein